RLARHGRRRGGRVRSAAAAARSARDHRPPPRKHRAVARGRVRGDHRGERASLTMARTGLRRSFRTIRAIMRREFIDVLRDRRSLALTFLYPISMLMMYGYGIRYD